MQQHEMDGVARKAVDTLVKINARDRAFNKELWSHYNTQHAHWESKNRHLREKINRLQDEKRDLQERLDEALSALLMVKDAIDKRVASAADGQGGGI